MPRLACGHVTDVHVRRKRTHLPLQEFLVFRGERGVYLDVVAVEAEAWDGNMSSLWGLFLVSSLAFRDGQKSTRRINKIGEKTHTSSLGRFTSSSNFLILFRSLLSLPSPSHAPEYCRTRPRACRVKPHISNVIPLLPARINLGDDDASSQKKSSRCLLATPPGRLGN